MKRRLVLLSGIATVAAAAALLVGLGTASAARKASAATGNIVQVAQGAGQFTTLVSLLQKAGLADTLAGPGPFTVLAPTDAAFAAVPKAALDALAADPAKLKAVLLYHVIQGNVGSSQVVTLKSAPTLNGTPVAIRTYGSSVFVNGAQVIAPDVQATNGVIHVIDKVLLPPALTAPTAITGNIVQTAVAAGSFTTLVSLVQKAGLADVLSGPGPFTVFAPTDAAFAKLPKATLDAVLANPSLLRSILLYHVVAGNVPSSAVFGLAGAPTLNGSSVALSVPDAFLHVDNAAILTNDVRATNGVIHVIDTVLIPPSAVPNPVPAQRGGYCAVAGNVRPGGAPWAPGTFLNLALGQPGFDEGYAGATPATVVPGVGAVCP